MFSEFFFGPDFTFKDYFHYKWMRIVCLFKNHDFKEYWWGEDDYRFCEGTSCNRCERYWHGKVSLDIRRWSR